VILSKNIFSVITKIKLLTTASDKSLVFKLFFLTAVWGLLFFHLY